MADFIEGEVRALTKRGLTEETCRKFDLRIGEHKGQTVQVATYWRDGGRVYQKVRTADKRFWGIGDAKACGLYGQHLWPSTGKRVVVTEGELDAASVAQAFGLSWPAVSVSGGAGNAAAAIKAELKWLEGYDEVVLWFDNDEAGRAAVAECVPLFTPGKVKVGYAPAPHKDASDMLQAGEVKTLCRVVYDATPWRPEGIVSIGALREKALAPVQAGTPYPWEGVTKAAFGRRPGEVIALGAGSGVGKTDLFTQMIDFDLKLGLRVGVIYLEQPSTETAKRIAGKRAGKRFHVPDGSWTQAELEKAFDEVAEGDRLHLVDAFGATDWSIVRAHIRYLVVSLGCQHVYLDHLTALAAAADDERKALEQIMAELAGDAKELGIVLHFVSHLATPEGKPHEEGGRVMAKHFKGSRAIIYWSHFMFGLERNTQAEDPEERAVATLRCLKDRFTGNANGLTWSLRYDRDTGRLTEIAGVPKGPFGDVTKTPDRGRAVGGGKDF